MVKSIDRARAKPGLDVLIVEGIMVTELEQVMDRLDCTVFLTIGKEECRRRREGRVYDPPDEKG